MGGVDNLAVSSWAGLSYEHHRMLKQGFIYQGVKINTSWEGMHLIHAVFWKGIAFLIDFLADKMLICQFQEEHWGQEEVKKD